MRQPETALGVRAASGALSIEKCEMTDKGWDDDGRWPAAVASRAAWWNPLRQAATWCGARDTAGSTNLKTVICCKGMASQTRTSLSAYEFSLTLLLQLLQCVSVIVRDRTVVHRSSARWRRPPSPLHGSGKSTNSPLQACQMATALAPFGRTAPWPRAPC